MPSAVLPESLVVRTVRLVLRPLAAADRAEFVRALQTSHAHLAPWSPATEPGETADSQFDRQLHRTAEGIARDADYRFSAWLGDGGFLGMFNLNNIVRGVFQNAFAGWWLSAGAVGRGYAFEALQAVLSRAFEPAPTGLGLHRVQANIIPTNDRSIRLAERVGFRREGLARAYLKIAGEWQDHVMFAKLASEHRPAAPARVSRD